MTLDITDTLLAKSNQMNADDLVSGPTTVQVTNVSRAEGEQPIAVAVSGHKPWMPCKTMRRLLAAAWGPDAGAWVGRWAVLYREPTVKWAGEEIGGIRVTALSDIKGPMTIKLAEKKGGKKLEYKIAVYTPSAMPLAEFKAHLGHAIKNGWTQEQIVTIMGSKSDDVPPDNRRAVVDQARGLPPTVATTTDEMVLP